MNRNLRIAAGGVGLIGATALGAAAPAALAATTVTTATVTTTAAAATPAGCPKMYFDGCNAAPGMYFDAKPLNLVGDAAPGMYFD